MFSFHNRSCVMEETVDVTLINQIFLLDCFEDNLFKGCFLSAGYFFANTGC
ncbi:hypothetical protein GGR09_000815 [Bartonella heixiaziensis]